ncbi:hypothetical protein COOONC_15652 [Cooperia oncophora]
MIGPLGGGRLREAEMVLNIGARACTLPSPKIDIFALSKLLNSIPKFSTARRQDDSDSGGEDMSTEIEELRDAAKSIQSLQRVLKMPQHSSDKGDTAENKQRIMDIILWLVPEYWRLQYTQQCSQACGRSSIAADSSVDGRVSGISTRLGHPRGVMQFLPSMGNDVFVSAPDTYRGGRPSLSRKPSAPDGFISLNDVLSNSEQPINPINSRGSR